MRYPVSDALYTRALQITPTGANTASKARDRFGGAFPSHLVRGQGSHVWDPDGHELIDWIASLCAVTLGHAHPAITAAVERQARDGGTMSLPHSLEVEVSEQLCAALGWEMVRWVSTGSEATEAAVRIARMVTGRDRVVSMGYHSWYSTFTAARPVHPGVPDDFTKVIVDVPYNDLERLSGYLRPWSPTYDRVKVAAVILEPALIEEPASGYLQKVVDRAHEHGALVIFDEIVCGLRWDLRGGSGYYGVTPDLACYGKALSNGAFPVAAVLGPRDLMRHAWPISGTANAHPAGLAAVQAVLEVYAEGYPVPEDAAGGVEPVCARLWATGRALGAYLTASLRACDLPARTIGPGIRPVLRWDHPEGEALMTLWLQECVARGVLCHPGGLNPMAAHTEADLDRTARVFLEVAAVLREALEAGAVAERIQGAVRTQSVLRAG